MTFGDNLWWKCNFPWPSAICIDEMPRNPLDDLTADRLLGGTLDPEDAPPGFTEVAALFAAARGQVIPVQLASRDTTVSAIAAAVSAAAGVSPTTSRKRGSSKMIGKLLTLKALGLALPAMALTAGSAAAASGALPAPAQAAVHNVLSHVGISVPKGNQSPSGKAVGPVATGSAQYGLCTAAHANGGHASSQSVAFANVQKAAAAAGESVQQYCVGVIQSADGTTGSNDMSAPNDSTPAGRPSSTPGSGKTPVTTPAGPPSSTPIHKR